MEARQIQLIQGTPEWLEWRRGGVGASDAPALLGKSPYKTKRDLFFEKHGLGDPDDEDRSFIFRKGHETEAELRELFSKHTKIEINPACFEKDEIFRASLDGYDKSLGILEAKLVGKDALKKAILDGEIPEHHRIQIQAQLFSSDSDKAFWGAKAPNVEGGVVVEIGRDEQIIKLIRHEVKDFWNDFLENRTPPLTADDTLFLSGEDDLLLAKRFETLKRQMESIKNVYETLELQLKSLATHSRCKVGNLSILEIEKKGAIDYTRIPEVKELAEHYLEKFRKKASKYKQIRLSKAGADE